MFLRALFATVLLVLSTTFSFAFDSIEVVKQKDRKGVERVFIKLDGFVRLEDDIEFMNLADQHKNLYGLILSGPGGSYDAGSRIADYVREKRLVTIVDKGQDCSSVCAIISLAGKIRMIYEDSRVGLHRAYSAEYDMETRSPVRDEQGNIKVIENPQTFALNALISYKFGLWGIPEAIIKVWNNTDPRNGVTFITAEINRQYKLGYIVLKG